MDTPTILRAIATHPIESIGIGCLLVLLLVKIGVDLGLIHINIHWED